MPAYDLKARIAKLQELEARGVIKPEHSSELAGYRQRGMVPAPAGRAKTTTQDMTELRQANAKAVTERDAMRTYVGAAKAVDDFGPLGTGPTTAWWLDAITPEESRSSSGGGIGGALYDMGSAALDTLGAGVGLLARPLVSQRTWGARDHLKTVNAKAALAASGDVKGAASDADMALMRMSSVSPYKQPQENHRVIKDAIYQSGLEQARALITSDWISKYGSINNPSPNGQTFEKTLQYGEQRYADRRAESEKRRSLPKPPPSARGRMVTIDLDGNIIE